MPGTTAVEIVTILSITYTNNSQACTLVGGIADIPSCTSISGCIPTKAVTQVQAGSSPVRVGTLTGTALYTSISSALETLCPPVTQTITSTTCATTGQVIRGISYVADENLENDGELTVRAEVSSYNETSLRGAMIHSAALTAQQASTSVKNCYNQSYIVEQLKRSLSPSRFNLLGRDHPYPEVEKIQFCNSVSFAAIQFYNEFWRSAPEPGPTNYIYANWEFSVGPGGEFACEFLGDLADAFITIAPEFAIEDVALGEEIRVTCEEAIQNGLLKK